MARKLTHADRQAIDTVLDRSPAAPVAVADAPGEPRVQAVEKILTLLAAMPADEPAAELTRRTVDRIAGTPLHPAAQQPAPAPYAGPSQLSA